MNNPTTTVLNLARSEYETEKHIRKLLVKNCIIMYSHLFGDDMGYYKDPDTGKKEIKNSHNGVLFVPMTETAAVQEIKNQYVGSMYDADPKFIGQVKNAADIDAAIIKIGGTKSAKLKTKTINGKEYLSIDVSNNSALYDHVTPVLMVDHLTNMALPLCDETDKIANAKFRNGTWVSASISFSPSGVKCFANIHAMQYVQEGDGTMATAHDEAKEAVETASAFGAPQPDAAMAEAATSEPAFGSVAPATSEPAFGSATPATSQPAFGSATPATSEPAFGSAATSNTSLFGG